MSIVITPEDIARVCYEADCAWGGTRGRDRSDRWPEASPIVQAAAIKAVHHAMATGKLLEVPFAGEPSEQQRRAGALFLAIVRALSADRVD